MVLEYLPLPGPGISTSLPSLGISASISGPCMYACSLVLVYQPPSLVLVYILLSLVLVYLPPYLVVVYILPSLVLVYLPPYLVMVGMIQREKSLYLCRERN